jgi:thiosulfate reductase cytochrome b subunit
VQKLLYTGIILTAVVIVLSGLSIWKPVQFQELTALFGGYDFARYVHFAAMWVLVINGIVYVTLGLATGRFRRKLLPIYPFEVIADVKAALTFRLAHDDLTHYNAVQKLLYTGIILTGVVIVLSGLAIWKPVQFQELTAFFGGYDFARYVHFAAMAAIVGFLIVHVALALLVPRSLRDMITGK